MNEIMLSIYVTTYNHGRYIGQALDSILMQKTQYSYEVLIGDDVSQDNTREILKAYEEAYPGKFTVYYREHNMNHQYPNNGDDLRARCRGKYVIALEGDDFWTDEYKIEKQINFLESHPEYIAVAHNCTVVDETSRPKEEEYPECKDSLYTWNHYVSEILPGQLATVMYRNYLNDETINTSILTQNMNPTDRLIYFMLASYGRIFCMQEKMSAYRHVTNGGSSFSANNRYNFERIELWHRRLLEYAYSIDNVSAQKCAEVLYMSRIVNACTKRKCSVAKGYRNLTSHVRHMMRTVGLYSVYKMRKNILKKDIYLEIDKVE